MLTPPSAGRVPGSARRSRYQCRHIRSPIQRRFLQARFTLAKRSDYAIAILDEYLRVLSYPKFELSEKEIKELIEEEILPYAEVVKPKRRLRVIERDPADNKFLECAVAGKAGVIISGDKDLLSLGRYRKIRIQSPAQFLADRPDLPES
jgi:putative PIN family toxin of toxin-antitoxin system